MKRTPLPLAVCAFFAGAAVTSITQEQLERRWRQQDIEDAITLKLMREIAPGEFGAELPVMRGELARILVEARPYLRSLQALPDAPAAARLDGPHLPAQDGRPLMATPDGRSWDTAAQYRYYINSIEYPAERPEPVVRQLGRLKERVYQLEQTVKNLEDRTRSRGPSS